MLIGLALLAGACNPFAPKVYRSMAVIQAGGFGDLTPSEVLRVKRLAARERKPGREITVECQARVGVINIAVLAESPRDAADTCSRIADAFIAGSKGKAHYIIRAEPPTKPVN